MDKCCKCCRGFNHFRHIKPGPCERSHDHHHCEKNNHSDKNVNQCKGCICNQLRRLRTQTEVDVFLSGGQVLEDVIFVSFDRRSCCAFFNDPTTEPDTILIVDCQEIQAIRLEAV